MFIGTKLGANYFKDGIINPLPIPPDLAISFYMVDNLGHIWLNGSDSKLICIKDGKRIDNHPVFSLLDDDEIIFNFHTNFEADEMSLVTNKGKIIRWDGLGVNLVLGKQKLYRPLYGANHQLFGVGADSLYQINDNASYPIMPLNDLNVRFINLKYDIYLVDKKTASRLFHYDGTNLYEFKQNFNLIMDILIDDEKNVWIGTESGLWRLQSRGFQNFLADPSNNFYTWTVLQDQEDNMWMGSYLYGLKKYDGKSISDIPVMHLFKNNGKQVFYSGGVRSDNGDLFFGTAQGVLALKNEKFDWIYQDKSNDAILFTYEDKKRNKFLAASARHGLLEFDKKGNIYYHHDREPTQNTGLVTCVLIDKYESNMDKWKTRNKHQGGWKLV